MAMVESYTGWQVSPDAAAFLRSTSEYDVQILSGRLHEIDSYSYQWLPAPVSESAPTMATCLIRAPMENAIEGPSVTRATGWQVGRDGCLKLHSAIAPSDRRYAA